MMVCHDIVVFPKNRNTHFFKVFENYKYFLLFGPNNQAKQNFVSLYRDTVGEKAIFWNKDNLVESIGKDYEVVPAVFNQIMKLEREWMQVLITAYDPIILASTSGTTLSSRTRLLNSISKDMIDRNRKVAFFFDYLETDLDKMDTLERQLAKEKRNRYNWPNEGEFKFYDRIIYAFESCHEEDLSVEQKDYEAISSKIALVNRR